jgi:HD-GYP domain-containing protein (c-di-GMP phosphodiesterase class II)
VTRIVLLPPREGGAGADAQAPDLRERALRTYQEALDFLRTSMTELQSPGELNQRRAKRVIHKLVDLSYEEVEGFSLFGLASIKSHDAYTFNHMVNVCVLAIAFGQRLGFTRQELAELGLCALYHDLGKLEVPLEVLNKPGKLSPEEWALMGNHTVFGARALFPLLAYDRRVARRMLAVLQHHYGHDAKGYPNLRLLTRQTLYARIIAVVDLYDAMTTKRVYQEEFLPDAALRRMQELAGRYCDPLLAKAFTNCMGIFPAGATVELHSGELAVVVEPNRDPELLDRPRVRVISDRRKARVEPFLVDLASGEGTKRAIRCCVDPEARGINAAHYAVQ